MNYQLIYSINDITSQVKLKLYRLTTKIKIKIF